MDGRSWLNMAAGSSMRRVLRKFFIVTIFRKRYVPNRRVGSYQEVGTYRSTFAVISLWGKFGGLHACGDTFPHMVPLPNIFLTLLCSIQRLKRKDFQEIARLAWAQEARGSNPRAPTIRCKPDCECTGRGRELTVRGVLPSAQDKSFALSRTSQSPRPDKNHFN